MSCKNFNQKLIDGQKIPTKTQTNKQKKHHTFSMSLVWICIYLIRMYNIKVRYGFKLIYPILALCFSEVLLFNSSTQKQEHGCM